MNKLVFISNNLMVMGLYALKKQGLVDPENTIIFHGNKVNPALFAEFRSHKMKIAHGCHGWRKHFCLRKFVHDVKNKIDEVFGDSSYELITPHVFHVIYQIAFLDERCTSVSYLEEGSLNYSGVHLAKLHQLKPMASFLYGHKVFKEAIYFSEKYKTAYGLSTGSFKWAKDKRVVLQLPDTIPGYKFKTDPSCVILAVPKLYLWGNHIEEAQKWNDNARKMCEDLGLKVILKPHPGHYNEVRLNMLREAFPWVDEVNADNELIVEMEVPSKKTPLISSKNSLADILPRYGCDISIIDFKETLHQ